MKWVDVSLFAFTHSGSTYLLNMLFELGVCIYRNDFDFFWEKRPADFGWNLNPREKKKLGVWFPSFQNLEGFRFRNNIRVSWSHGLPRASDYQHKCIFMIRDGRDVIASSAKRIADGMLLREFLRRPLAGEYGLCGMYPPYEWAVYNAIVVELLATTDFIVVRYEDLKKEPLVHLKRVLAFLDIHCNEAELDAAISASDSQRVKEFSDTWYKKHPDLAEGKWRAMSRGQVGSWKDDAECLDAAFRGVPEQILIANGYEVLEDKHKSSGNAVDGVSACGINLEGTLSSYKWMSLEYSEQKIASILSGLSIGSPSTYQLGCAIYAADVVNSLLNSPYTEMAGAKIRVFRKLLSLFVDLRPTALVLSKIAIAIGKYGMTEQACSLIRRAIPMAKDSFFELRELALVHLDLSGGRLDIDLCGSAIRCAPTCEEINSFADAICILASPSVVRVVLRSHSPGLWNDYVRHRSEMLHVPSWRIYVSALIPERLRQRVRGLRSLLGCRRCLASLSERVVALA